MALRQIRTIPDPILRKTCRLVDKITPKILELMDDMRETMTKADGVGIAAPQVGVLKRIIMVEVEGKFLELINPHVLEETGQVLSLEGCLSIPDVMAYVYRPQSIKIQGLNREGKLVAFNITGMLAVAISHEMDHINGILFTDKQVEPTEEEEKAYLKSVENQ